MDNATGAVRSRRISPAPLPPTTPVAPSASATDARDARLWAATVHLLWPWRYREYRGWIRSAAAALGMKTRTVERWMYGGREPMSSRAARQIAVLLRQRATRAHDLAEAWEAYQIEREAAEAQNIADLIKRGRRGRRLRTVNGWISTAPDAIPRAGTHAAT